MTTNPIWSLGNINVNVLGDARAFAHENSYELSEGSLAFKVTADGTAGRQGLFSKDSEFFDDGGHFTVWIDDGEILARLQSEDRSYTVSGGNVVPGQSTAVAVTFGGAGFKLYVDGGLVGQSGYKGGLLGNEEPIVVGASQWASNAGATNDLNHEFKGTISEVGLYDTALQAGEIQDLAGLQGPDQPETPSAPEPDELARILLLAEAEIGGLNDAKVVSHNAAYELSDGTLAFSVTADGTAGRQGLVSKDASFFGTGGHLSVWIEDGQILARLQSKTDSYELVGGKVVAGEQLAVAVSFGENGFELYVDGERVDQSEYKGGLEGNKEPLVVGASGWASSIRSADDLTHEFQGKIADVALYDGALSVNAIRSLADQTPITGEEPEQPVEEPEQPVEKPEQPVEEPEQPVEEPEQPDLPVEPANATPLVLGPSVDITLDAGKADRVMLPEYFMDPDGDVLSFKFSGAPGFVKLEENELVVAPKDGDNGTYNLKIFASDGKATSKALSAKVVVKDVIKPDVKDDDFTPQSVKLTADVGIVKNGKIGTQEWGQGVSLTGYDLNGKLAEVFTSLQWKDVGFGVKGAGSRWDDQIDFYASGGGRSEKMVIDFNGDVRDVVLKVGMLGITEGPNNTPETGVWRAYDDDGKMVDKGLIGPDFSMLGTNKKVGQSYGLYPIEIDTDRPIERLELEATQFDYGKGNSKTMSYGENSSDFNVVGVDFLRVEPVDEFLF